MNESRYDDTTLAAYVEGLLPEDEATELKAAAEHNPELAARLELMQRMLDQPVVSPLTPPAELAAWLRAEVASAAAAEGAEPDLLEGGVELAPVEVPGELTAWVQDAARRAARAEDDPATEARGELVAFPSRALLQAAAGVLVALCLGGAAGWIARGPGGAPVAATSTELERLRGVAGDWERQAVESQTETTAAELALNEAQGQVGALSARLEASEAQRAAALAESEQLGERLALKQAALLAARDSELDLKQERNSLLMAKEALVRERDSLALQLAENDSAAALAAAQRAAAQGAARADRAEALAAKSAAQREELSTQIVALKSELAGNAASFAVTQSRGVQRWKQGRWQSVADGATLSGGDILRGGAQAAIQVGRRWVRLGHALYRVRAEGLEPLPSVSPPTRRVLGGVLATRKSPERDKPGTLQRAGAAFLPFLR